MEVYISLYLLINQYSSVNLAIRRARFDFIKRLEIQGGGKTQRDAVNSEENRPQMMEPTCSQCLASIAKH